MMGNFTVRISFLCETVSYVMLTELKQENAREKKYLCHGIVRIINSLTIFSTAAKM